MKIKMILKKILFPYTYNSDSYIKYLRSKDVTVGDNCYIWSPNHTFIDHTQGFLLKIGNCVKIARGSIVLAHDYSVFVARRVYKNHIGGGRITTIGNNVFLGMNSIILPGASIGNNCIIGAGSVVSGCFPDNSVICGNPAKIMCTLEEFYQKKKNNEFKEACTYVKAYYEKYKRFPKENEMGNAFIWLYLPRNKENVKKYEKMFRLSGDVFENVVEDFMNSKQLYNNFDEFIYAIKKEINLQ